MIRITIVVSIFALFLSSCKTLSSTKMFDVDSDYQYNNFSQTPKDFIIKPFDQLNIVMATNDGAIFLEQTFTTSDNYPRNRERETITYMVSEDSLVKIPTLGRVKLAGLTVREAEEKLETAFSENFQNPFVKITITNRKVLLFLEEGTSAQVITLPEENMTLMEALAVAGGLSENSKAYKIKLIRGDNKNPQVFKYNIRSLDEFRKADFNLTANDIIYVESRPRYLNKVITEIQPYLVLLSSSILVYSVFK